MRPPRGGSGVRRALAGGGTIPPGMPPIEAHVHPPLNSPEGRALVAKLLDAVRVQQEQALISELELHDPWR